MKKIAGLLLSRFKNLKPPEKCVEKEVKEIIDGLLGFSANGIKIIYKRPKLSITVYDSVFKSEIFLKKESIKTALNKKLGKTPLEIYFK